MAVINSGYPTGASDKETYFPLYMNTISTYFENLTNFPNNCNNATMWTIENLFNSDNNYQISNYYFLKNPAIGEDSERICFRTYPFISVNNPNAKLILWNDEIDFNGNWSIYVCARDTTNHHNIIDMSGSIYSDTNNIKYGGVGFDVFASYNRYPNWDGTYAMLPQSNMNIKISDEKIYLTSWARYIMTSDTSIKESSIDSYVANRGSKPTSFDTNIPMFCKGQEQALQDYIINGTTPSYITTKTNFKLWIKGLDSPTYKLNWHNSQLELENYDFSQATVQLEVGYLVSDGVIYNTLYEVPFNDGSIKFTFYDLANIHQDNIFTPWLYFRMYVIYNDNDKSGKPHLQLQRKAPYFNSMYKDIVYGEDGSTLEVVNYNDDPSGFDDDDDDYHDPSDNDDNTPDDSTDITVSGEVCKTFKIEDIELKKLSQFLWTSDFFDNVLLVNNSPIENIISLKALIGTVTTTGSSQALALGNVTTTANAIPCNESIAINVGSITLPRKYNNFLDFEPYTKVQIYLPFYGCAMLDSSLVIGRTISIKYIIDVITATAKIKIIHDNKTLYEFKTTCGSDLPITSSNRASVEMGYLSSGVGMGISIASGNVLGGLASGLSMAQSQYHSSTSGNVSGVLNFHDSRMVTVLIDRPVYTELRNFNKTHGRVCNLSKTLRDLRGFTKCAENVQIAFNCLDEERTMIIEQLVNGVII